MLDRLIGTCLTVLAGAAALYVAVRLVESVAAALLIIAAVAGALVVGAGIASLLWRRSRMDRW